VSDDDVNAMHVTKTRSSSVAADITECEEEDSDDNNDDANTAEYVDTKRTTTTTAKRTSSARGLFVYYTCYLLNFIHSFIIIGYFIFFYSIKETEIVGTIEIANKNIIISYR
jgi:hypothetical protein